MTNEETFGKLTEMRLTAMANAFREQAKNPAMTNLSFEERFGLLTDIEWSSRKNNRLKKLIKDAQFDQPNAHIGDINYNIERKLDRSQILTLASCSFIRANHNIIIMGAAGSGKSYLACAFGMEACKQFYSARYIRLPDLLTDLAMARGDGTYKRLMKQYQKINLLIIDEWMLVSLKESEARDLLEIIHNRHKRASTIFCSQFLPAGWHAKIGESTLADAILDRIVHDSYSIEIHSSPSEPSMREVYGLKGC